MFSLFAHRTALTTPPNHLEVDAMATTLQTLTQLLAATQSSESQPQAVANTQQAVETETFQPPLLTPPLSLITPPLPPTTHVETRPDTTISAAGDDRDGATVGSNANGEPLARSAAVTDQRSGIYASIGKLFYLRG
jgi:hypothetical protein